MIMTKIIMALNPEMVWELVPALYEDGEVRTWSHEQTMDANSTDERKSAVVKIESATSGVRKDLCETVTSTTNEEGEKVTRTTWVSSKVFHVKKTVTTVTRVTGTPPPPAPRGPATPPPPSPSSASSDAPGSPRESQEAPGDGDSEGYPDNVSERSRPSESLSLLETTSSESYLVRYQDAGDGTDVHCLPGDGRVSTLWTRPAPPSGG